jgi:hypothetical protein
MRSAELVGVAQTIACCGEVGGIGRRCDIAPQVEIIVERRARRQVLGDRPPLTPGAQDIHQAVDDFAHDDMTPIAVCDSREAA